MTDPTAILAKYTGEGEPSAVQEQCAFDALIEAKRLGRQLFGQGGLVIEIRTGRLKTIIAGAIVQFVRKVALPDIRTLCEQLAEEQCYVCALMALRAQAEAERDAALSRLEAAEKALHEIANMEGQEGMTDYKFAEVAIGLVAAYDGLEKPR